MNQETYKIAAVQAAPIQMDRDATVEKGCRLMAKAARSGARLVVFTEAFIPAYPDWIRKDPYRMYIRQSGSSGISPTC